MKWKMIGQGKLWQVRIVLMVLIHFVWAASTGQSEENSGTALSKERMKSMRTILDVMTRTISAPSIFAESNPMSHTSIENPNRPTIDVDIETKQNKSAPDAKTAADNNVHASYLLGSILGWNLDTDSKEEANAISKTKNKPKDFSSHIEDAIGGQMIIVQRMIKGRDKNGVLDLNKIKRRAGVHANVVDGSASVSHETTRMIKEILEGKEKLTGSNNGSGGIDGSLILFIVLICEGGLILIAFIILAGVISFHARYREAFLEDFMTIGYSEDDDISMDLFEYPGERNLDLIGTDPSKSFKAVHQQRRRP